MERVELAKGYTISRVLVGCWRFSAGHSASISQERAIDDLSMCARAGITTFDCADIYSGVEDLLGAFRKEYLSGLAAAKAFRFLEGSRYEQLGLETHEIPQIHTKFVPDLEELPRISRIYVERIIDRSLRRLNMERLDLVQFHWWDFGVPRYVETAQWLADLQRAGKIRYLGVTNFDTPHLKEVVESGIEVVSNQVQYSLLDQRPEHTMVPFCRQHNIKLLCYGTLAGGFLSSRYLGTTEPREQLENRSLTKYKLVIDDVGGWDVFQTLLQTLNKISKKYRVSIANVATRFVLERSEVGGVIVGHSRSRRPYDTLRVFDFSLDEDDYRAIRSVLAQLRFLPDDVYSLERIIGGKHAQIMRYNLNAQ